MFDGVFLSKSGNVSSTPQELVAPGTNTGFDSDPAITSNSEAILGLFLSTESKPVFAYRAKYI